MTYKIRHIPKDAIPLSNIEGYEDIDDDIWYSHRHMKCYAVIDDDTYIVLPHAMILGTGKGVRKTTLTNIAIAYAFTFPDE